MSAVPPFSEADLFMASTSARESHETVSATSLDVFGGIGRVVNVLHLAYVKSITLIDSLHTMNAAVSSVNCGVARRTRAWIETEATAIRAIVRRPPYAGVD